VVIWKRNMKKACVPVLLALWGCAGRPVSPNPYVPPDAMYSPASTMAAAGGVMATAVGAQMTTSGSSGTRAAGMGVLAAGIGLLGAALIDAIQVEEARKRLIATDAAWRAGYMYRPLPDAVRPPPPPLPEVPFEFPVEESPLGESPP
jgi:hypothetical protein